MIIKTDKFDSIVQNVVYISFFIHQFAFLFGASELAYRHEPYHSIAIGLKIVPFLIMLLSAFYFFLRGKFSLNEIIIYIVIAIPLLISLYNYRVVMVISNLFYLIIFKNVDANKGLETALYATILGFVLNVMLGIFTKYTGNCIQVRYGVERIRHGLGFYFAYMTSYFYLTIILIYILVKKNIRWFELLALMVFNIIVFVYTDTKAPFTYGTLSLLLYLLFVKFNNKILYSIFKTCVIIAYPVAVLLSIMLPYYYLHGNKYWDLLNKIVNTRLSLTQKAFEVCGWKWLGQNPGIWGNGAYYIDSAMASMFVQNGLIVLIMSVIFMTIFSYMAVKIEHKPLMIVLSVMALRAIFDLGFMSMQLGPVIVLFYEVLNRFIKRDIKSA